MYNKDGATKGSNPTARSAHNKIAYRISTGEITKPKSCSECGLKTDMLDSHHGDHHNPFRVKWLCKSCHQKITQKEK